MKIITLLLSFIMIFVFTNNVFAETLNWARAGDSLTMDPHGQNEGPTHSLASQIYEPLIQRDMAGKQVAALATKWGPKKSDPNVWAFKLRVAIGNRILIGEALTEIQQFACPTKPSARSQQRFEIRARVPEANN